MPCISSHDASSRRPAKGFTLVELLVSITILVILATVTLYGMASVQKMAQVQRAKSQIARIHELIMEKWESYETRSVATNPQLPPGGMVAYSEPDLRLLAIRELMRFEMPDRASDLVSEPQVLATVPPFARSLRNRNSIGSINSAECLYQIIARINVGDASALEFFSEDEIGDDDSDGWPEILDPWGQPIFFVRWPAGYSTSANVTFNETPIAGVSSDPMDFSLRERFVEPAANTYGSVQRVAHAMVPLIYSSGPDRERGVLIEAGTFEYATTNIYRKAADTNATFWPNDPFAVANKQSSMPFQIGFVDKPDLAADNVTNHLISTGIK